MGLLFGVLKLASRRVQKNVKPHEVAEGLLCAGCWADMILMVGSAEMLNRTFDMHLQYALLPTDFQFRQRKPLCQFGSFLLFLGVGVECQLLGCEMKKNTDNRDREGEDFVSLGCTTQ